MRKLQKETTKDKFDKSKVATKFLSKVLENSIRQNLFCELRDEKNKTSISEKKAIKILNSNLIVPIEAKLDSSHMLCCLKNFEEQGIMYVMYEDIVENDNKIILVSEECYDDAYNIITKHEENQGISNICRAYGKVAEDAINRFYQDRYDLLNVNDNNIEEVIEFYRDREGINGHVCYLVNRTNPENIAEIITIKKYKNNGAYVLISEINIYKFDERVKSYSEKDNEYGHAWQIIKERIIDLLDAESGVVIFNTLQEVVRYKELFYEQLYLRNDLSDMIISPDMSQVGNSECYETIIDELQNELEVKECLFIEEKDNIREQIDNYRYIQVLMKEYEESVIDYMDKSGNSGDIYEEYKEWENNIKEELDEKENELEHYLLKSKILQIERLCIVRNCIGKSSAQLISENIDRNIAFRPEREIDLDDVSEPIIENVNTYGGLESKLIQARNRYEEQEENKGESVS